MASEVLSHGPRLLRCRQATIDSSKSARGQFKDELSPRLFFRLVVRPDFVVSFL